MRIAMISEHASPLGDGSDATGGVQQRHVADLSAALAELGHEVRVYTRRDEPDLPKVATTPGGVAGRARAGRTGPAGSRPTCCCRTWATSRSGSATSWRDGDWAPDVAHAHFWTSGLAAVTAARQIGIPVVQSFHELGGGRGRRREGASRSGYERALGRAVDRVVVQSQDEVRGLVRIGVPRAQLTLVPAGVDSDRFSPDGPAAERDPERPRILSVGRLVERKGFGDVIQAMRYVPGAECVVVGGPPADQLPTDPQARKLRAIAEQLPGRRPDPAGRRRAGRGHAALVPLRRPAGRRALERAVRAVPAGGDGLWRAGDRHHRGRPHRDRGGRPDRRPGRRPATRAPSAARCAGWSTTRSAASRTPPPRWTAPARPTRGSGSPSQLGSVYSTVTGRRTSSRGGRGVGRHPPTGGWEELADRSMRRPRRRCDARCMAIIEVRQPPEAVRRHRRRATTCRSPWSAARSSASSARTAPARPPPSSASPACGTRTAAAIEVLGRDARATRSCAAWSACSSRRASCRRR